MAGATITGRDTAAQHVWAWRRAVAVSVEKARPGLRGLRWPDDVGNRNCERADVARVVYVECVVKQARGTSIGQ